MPLKTIEAPYYVCDPRTRLQQGDLLRDLKIAEVTGVLSEGVEVAHRSVTYCVVLSQDCDLEHDFNAASVRGDSKDDKILPALLLCPAYSADLVKQGTHLQDQNKVMRQIGSDEWKKIKSNQSYRYHYLPLWADRQVPELVIDFKHYFTVPRTFLYRDQCLKTYLVTIEILYRELLSSRFAQYLSRIGLPDLASA
jgi:hypothetical protein